MQDIGATSNETLLQYTIGTEVEVVSKESKSPRSGIVLFKDYVTNHLDKELAPLGW